MSSSATPPVRAQGAAPTRHHSAPAAPPAAVTATHAPTAARGELVTAHVDAIRVACLRWLRGPDLDDCVQDAVVRALAGIDRLADPTRVRAYLRRIATNACIDRIRLGPPPLSLSELDREPSTPEEPANDERDAVNARVHRCIAALPEQQREVVMLFYFVGLSHHQIALRMGTTTTAVNQRLYRSRRTLAELLGPDSAPRRPRPRALQGRKVQGRKSTRSAFDSTMPDGRPASTTPHCA